MQQGDTVELISDVSNVPLATLGTFPVTGGTQIYQFTLSVPASALIATVDSVENTPGYTALENLIADAKAALTHAQANEGSGKGQFPTSAINDMTSAIAAAEAVLNNRSLTDADMAAATTNLQAGLDDLKNSQIGGGGCDSLHLGSLIFLGALGMVFLKKK